MFRPAHSCFRDVNSRCAVGLRQSSAPARSRRCRHQAVVSGSARCSSTSSSEHPVPGLRGPGDGEGAVDRQQRVGHDVTGQQRGGAQPAGVLQLGKGGGQGHPGRDAHRGVQGARHHGGEPALGHDLQRPGHPAQRRHLHHHDVGGVLPGHPDRVLGTPDRLVGSHRHVGAGSGQGHAQPGEVADVGDRLLGILQPVCREGSERRARLVEVPGPVGVHPDEPLGSEMVAHRGHPRQVVGEGLAPFGDLDLGGAAAGEATQDGGHPLRGDRRHRGVDRHHLTHGAGPR